LSRWIPLPAANKKENLMKFITLILAVCLSVPAFAQDATKDNPKFYKLDFVVKELDDNKVVSAKTYSAYTSADEKSRGASIRTGNRVPYQTAGGQFQYADVGVNIDCQSTREAGGQLILSIVADISSTPGGAEAAPNVLPMVRQNRWNSMVLVPIGKATTLFSSDDLNSKRRMQLEVTATPVK
jgi:hypothetical protein